MRPFLGSGAQPFPHGILPDVMMLGVFLVTITQAMVKETVLPHNSELPRGVAFPVLEHIFHHDLSRKTQQCMQMIWHEKPECDVPLPLVVVEPRSIQQSISNSGQRELF